MVRIKVKSDETRPNITEISSEYATRISLESLGAPPPPTNADSGKGQTRQRSRSLSDASSNKTGSVEKVVNMEKIKMMEKLFKCPVCLTLPICDIYQCKGGHLLCEDCHGKLPRPISCPSCRVPMVDTPIRNLAVEHVSMDNHELSGKTVSAGRITISHHFLLY